MWLSVSRPRAARLNGEHEPHTMGELAGVAQLAAHFTCNEGVRGSSPLAGSETASQRRPVLRGSWASRPTWVGSRCGCLRDHAEHVALRIGEDHEVGVRRIVPVHSGGTE